MSNSEIKPYKSIDISNTKLHIYNGYNYYLLADKAHRTQEEFELDDKVANNNTWIKKLI